MSFKVSRIENFGQKIEDFHEKIQFPKSIQDQYGMVPGSPRHEKTSVWIHWELPESLKTSNKMKK